MPPTAAQPARLSTRAAYSAGHRSWSTQLDWDDALDRFERRHLAGVSPVLRSSLIEAWCDGWSDATEGRNWSTANDGRAERGQLPRSDYP